MMPLPELLAPAGDMAGIVAAVNAGADAVYFGGRIQNARRRAANLSDEEIRHAVRLCHQNGVKTYVTLNTLIKDEEWDETVDYLCVLESAGIDGLIVQDPGLIYYLTQYHPELPLQTSTQASVCGLEGVRFFEALGFKRVVLPREMPLGEARKINDQVNVELKIFCHGALCYARSGQCLLSSLIGGRSGNRGWCAQPCRKQYTLCDDQNKVLNKGYLLSMKDLNTMDHLDEIADAGMAALKIEGRLKSPGYIYTVTKAYRERLDALANPSKTLSITDGQVAQSFNRDFTPGLLFLEENIINSTVGKNRGINIGKVDRWVRHKLWIDLKDSVKLAVGDGLAFGEDSRNGIRVDRVAYDRGFAVVPCRFSIPEGTPVFRNRDEREIGRIEALAAAPLSYEKEALDLSLTLERDKDIGFEAAAEGRCWRGTVPVRPETAQNKPLTDELVREQLSRLGDTDYRLNDLKLSMDDHLFLTRGQLNEVRRRIIEKGEDVRTEARPVEKSPSRAEKGLGAETPSPRVSAEIVGLPKIGKYLDLDVDEWVLPLDNPEQLAEMAAAVEMVRERGKSVVLAFPNVMNTDLTEDFRESLAGIRDLHADGYLIRNYEALRLLKDEPQPLEGDDSLHLFNRMAAMAFKAWRLTTGVLSQELDGAAVKTLITQGDLGCVLKVYGHQEAMVSDNCVLDCRNKHCENCRESRIFYLQDEQGGRFPVRRDANGITHIYNGDKLFLKAELRDLNGLEKIRLSLLDESPDEVAAVIEGYRCNLKWDEEKIEQYYHGRYTKGNYHRGVK